MKKTLKATLLVVVCLLMCTALFACAPAAAPAAEENGASSVEGKWVIKSVEGTDGTSASAEELAELALSYEFQSGGVLDFAAMGEEITGTWTQTGADVTIDIEGVKTVGVIDGDTLTFENEAGKTICSRV